MVSTEFLEVRGSHMAFITAGMGGGTGTGAAPVVAEVAKEMGILSVAVVTKPFSFEGVRRMQAAEIGIEELSQHVDSVIVILNEKLEEVLGDDVSMEEAFSAADSVLKNAVAGISEIINVPGLGQPQVARQSKPKLVQKTGTDNRPVAGVDYRVLDEMPAVIRKNRASTIEALQNSGVDKYDIPAFLRKQAD